MISTWKGNTHLTDIAALMGNEGLWRKLKNKEARGKRKITLPESFPKEMSNHLLLNDKSQSSGSGIVCGLFLMRKYLSLAQGLYGTRLWAVGVFTGSHHLTAAIPITYQQQKQDEKYMI